MALCGWDCDKRARTIRRPTSRAVRLVSYLSWINRYKKRASWRLKTKENEKKKKHSMRPPININFNAGAVFWRWAFVSIQKNIIFLCFIRNKTKISFFLFLLRFLIFIHIIFAVLVFSFGLLCVSLVFLLKLKCITAEPTIMFFKA